MVICRPSFSAFGAFRFTVLPGFDLHFQSGFISVLNEVAFSVNERAVLLKLIENSLYLHPVLIFVCFVVVNRASQRLLQDAFFLLYLSNEVGCKTVDGEKRPS